MCNLIKSILKCGVRLLLTVVNLLIFLAGVGLVAVGTYLFVEQPQEDRIDYEEGAVLITLGVITALGAVLTLIGFCGCCGALCNSSCMLKSYAIFEIVLTLGIAGSLAFCLIKADDLIVRWEDEVSTQYETNNSVLVERWDYRMRKRECCGVHSYKDWRGSVYSQTTSNVVPESCCVPEVNSTVEDVGKLPPKNYTLCQLYAAENVTVDGIYEEMLYTEGCIKVVSQLEVYIIVICSILLTFLILSLVLACCIAKKNNTVHAADDK